MPINLLRRKKYPPVGGLKFKIFNQNMNVFCLRQINNF